ncbi:MAG: hypothetical protein KDK07_05300 [Bauldia sp.]|nr:hypothetical protein [Bauldia sp.]
MAEYYTVLRRAIAGIDPNVPETRRAVYDKARNALIGQLKAVDPPLTTAEISRQRLELEEAIRRVEREAASGTAASIRPPAANRAAPPRGRDPEPAVTAPPAEDYEAPPPPSARDVFRRAVQDAGMRGDTDRTVPAPIARYEGAAPDLRGTAPPPRDRMPPPRGEPGERGGFPVRADANRYARPEYGRRPPPPETYREPEPEPYEPEPRLAPEYDQEWEAEQASAAMAPSMPQVDRRERAAPPPPPSRGRSREEAVAGDGAAAPKPRRSRLGGILVLVLILAVLGAIAAGAWTQREMISDLIADVTGSGADAPAATATEQPVLPPPPDEPATAEADTGKNTDRLLPGEPAPPGSDVRVVGGEDGGETADTMAAGPDTAMAEPMPSSASPGAESGGPQKAILYEEPADGAANAAVTAVDAAVTWHFVQDGPNGPEVQADLTVPERNMTIRFSLHKNADEALPASHLVEVVADTPSDSPGKAIANIPRIVLKPTEGARGQPLVGAAAKVADGFFWIALSAADTDIASNLSLMRDRNWIDLPFVYENGQRAIITFEKGPEGEAAFQQAFAAWGTG